MQKQPKSWPGEPEGLWDQPRPARVRRETRSADQRLASLGNEIILPYPRATRVRDEIEKIIERGRRAFWVGAMIAGPRSNGRSTLVKQITDEMGQGAWLLTMPTRAAFDDFWFALRAKARRSSEYYDMPSGARQTEAHRALVDAAKAGLQLIIVDCCENLLDVSAARRRLMLHCAAIAWDVSQVPVVLVGTPTLASRILSDRDRVGLYEIILLPQWRLNAEFLDLLQAWDDALPLKQASGLADRELAMHLYALSDGLLGVLASVLTKATIGAILTKEEKITIPLLDRIGLEVSPTFSGFLF
jgi:hypothetical protein